MFYYFFNLNFKISQILKVKEHLSIRAHTSLHIFEFNKFIYTRSLRTQEKMDKICDKEENLFISLYDL